MMINIKKVEDDPTFYSQLLYDYLDRKIGIIFPGRTAPIPGALAP